MQRQLTLWPTAWHPATCNSHRSGPRNGPFGILKQAISKRHTGRLTARCGIQGRARMLMLNLVAYLQPQSYCAHSLFLFPRAFAHCCLECTPKGPYRATDATVPHFLMPTQCRHNLHHLQTPGAPWPAQRQWHRRHRTHCSACTGWTLSGKPGISFIERHDHLAKC